MVEILAELPKYVCRAGHKLEAALDAFGVDPSGRVCLDAGLSTGGFTDCLLQRGAAAVYGVDVGYGQVAERIRTDPRVVVMERTNVRHLTASQMPPLPGTANAPLVDLVTLDLSFISVLKVLPAVVAVMQPNAQLIVLIKPQFEVCWRCGSCQAVWSRACTILRQGGSRSTRGVWCATLLCALLWLSKWCAAWKRWGLRVVGTLRRPFAARRKEIMNIWRILSRRNVMCN